MLRCTAPTSFFRPARSTAHWRLIGRCRLAQVFREAVSNFPQYEPAVLSTDPWVLTFDNLLSEAEANRLFELGAKTLEVSR